MCSRPRSSRSSKPQSRKIPSSTPMSMASTLAWKLGAISTRRSAMGCHGRGEYARDEDGDGFCEVHVNTIEGFWSLLRSWLRPHRGISQDKLPDYLGFFQVVHNARRRGKALLAALLAPLVR